jgi:hypothetical protein
MTLVCEKSVLKHAFRVIYKKNANTFFWDIVLHHRLFVSQPCPKKNMALVHAFNDFEHPDPVTESHIPKESIS